MFGVSLIDLKELLGSSINDISYGFVGRSAVYCVGSLVCGWAFNHINRQCGLGLSLLGCGLSIIVIPHLRSLFGFIIAQATLGFASAGVDIAANAWLLEIWQSDPLMNPILNSMHFFFALGMTLGPLLSEPFLSPDTMAVDSNLTDIQIEALYTGANNSIETRIAIPYTICSVMLLMTAMMMFVLVIKPYKGSAPTISAYCNIKEKTHSKLPKCYYYTVIVLGGLLLCFEASLEQNAFNYLQTFIVNVDLKLSKSKGAQITSAASAAYTIASGLSILLATKIKTVYMLYIDFVVATIGCVVMLIYGDNSEIGVWLGVCTIGFAISSAYPCIYSFLEERINVTNNVCGFFMFSSSILTTIEPIYVGKYIEKRPMIFVYANLINAIVCLVIYIALHSTDIMRSRSTTNQNKE